MIIDPLAGARARTRPRTVLALAVMLVLALVIQLTVVGRLGLPLGPPDLFALLVLSVALVTGPTGGAVAGFAGGLVADADSAHTLGRLALALCLVGYAVGLLGDAAERSLLLPLVILPLAGLLAFLVFLGTGAALGETLGGTHSVPARMLGLTVYDLVLVPLVYPPVVFVVNRLDRA